MGSLSPRTLLPLLLASTSSGKAMFAHLLGTERTLKPRSFENLVRSRGS